MKRGKGGMSWPMVALVAVLVLGGLPLLVWAALAYRVSGSFSNVFGSMLEMTGRNVGGV